MHNLLCSLMCFVCQVSNASNTQAMQWETEYALRTLPHTAMNDIPSFLEDCKGVILPTGEALSAPAQNQHQSLPEQICAALP